MVEQRAATLVSLAENIRRSIRHMHEDLTPGDDRDSRLIDHLNHMDTLAEQIENEMRGGTLWKT